MHTSEFGDQNPEWRKAAASVNNGECVEVATRGNRVSVRDSKLPQGLVLSYDKTSWSAFLEALKHD